MKKILLIVFCFLSILKVKSQVDTYNINSFIEGDKNFEIKGEIKYNSNENSLKIFIEKELKYTFKINHINRTRFVLVKKNAFAPTHLAEWHKSKLMIELMDISTKSTTLYYLEDDLMKALNKKNKGR